MTDNSVKGMPWTPGKWRAEIDDTLSGPVHVEQMREIDPNYKPTHDYWTVNAWRDGGGRYVAETGCHEHSEANAKLIAAAPELAEALQILSAKFAQMIELSPHCDPVQQDEEEKALIKARELLTRIGA